MTDNNFNSDFDFDSFESSLIDLPLNTDISDDFDSGYKPNDIFMDDKDTFDVGKLKTNNYNKDTIDKIPSEIKTDLYDMNIVGDKKDCNQIEYRNNEFYDDTYSNGNLLGEFYDLEIEDYPNRKKINVSSNSNKSLGARNNKSFISRMIDKIKEVSAR